MLEMWLDSIRQWITPVRKKHQVQECIELLQNQLEQKQNVQARAGDLYQSSSNEERRIVENIQEQTQSNNVNNLTRTSAYFDYYMRCPEIHWAFLAHMVSRNGGWNMTDLKGDLMPEIVSESTIQSLFLFLEKANWLIFGDAYPQLLLYEQSKRIGKPLFHLLPDFHVSKFMQCIWEWFWRRKDSEILTMALITNEQQFIETHLLHTHDSQEHVMQSTIFQLQNLFNMSVVLFPTGTRQRVLGLAVDHFGSVERRIEVGKQLYAMLFRSKSHYQLITKWASSVPHTGSRADFWPQTFTRSQEAKRRTANAGKPDLVWSPNLWDVWPNHEHSPVTPNDWFQSQESAKYLYPLWIPSSCDMTNRYKRMLRLLTVDL